MRPISSRLCLLVAGVAFVAGSSFAQTPNQTPAPAAPLDSVQSETKPGAPAQNLSEKLNQSKRRHPPERGGSGHREAGAQGGRFERGAAARDFRRRCRAAAKMSARFLRLAPGSKLGCVPPFKLNPILSELLINLVGAAGFEPAT
jgi:hypothetical protein